MNRMTVDELRMKLEKTEPGIYWQGKDGPVFQNGGPPGPIIFKLEEPATVKPIPGVENPWAPWAGEEGMKLSMLELEHCSMPGCPQCQKIRDRFITHETLVNYFTNQINNTNQETKGNSMIIEVAVVSVPSIVAQQNGSVEKLILPPTPVVAQDERAAIVSAVLANHKNFEKVEPSTLKVIVRSLGN